MKTKKVNLLHIQLMLLYNKARDEERKAQYFYKMKPVVNKFSKIKQY